VPADEYEDKTAADLVAMLESCRESAMVSIQIVVKVLLPEITHRTYKNWMAHLANPDGVPKKYPPTRHRRSMLVKAVKAMKKCLAEGLLPKTRLEIHQEGKQVMQYKKQVLSDARKSIK
tara:strand:- start:7438 stop:7794 length:357 start_codon:yes stop_codon:yes gene_type:complete